MRILISLLAAVLFSWILGSCGSSSTPTFCDTTCNNDMLKYSSSHPDSPFVNLSVRNCQPDTIVWSHRKLPTTRKMGFVELVGKEARLHKDFISCYFKDTSYAWLKFNDCITGRGFLVKLPYSKTDKWSIYTSALNNFDRKFNVQDGVIAYYDDTFIYAQNIETGKIDRMLLNDTKLDIDHNNVHKTFDSIHVTRDRIWANILVNAQYKVLEKKIDINTQP